MSKNGSPKPYWAAFLVCLCTGSVWWYVLCYKYFHLSYNDWDLAFFTQSCWNLLHGTQFDSLVGINYFGDHSYFITFLYLPVFDLFPHPLTLVFLKLAAYLITAFMLFKVFYRHLNFPLSLGLMMAYLWFPANILALLYEFNPESLSMPFIILMFDAYDQRRWKMFWTSAVFLLLIKENFALLTAAFCIWGLWTAKEPVVKKHAAALLAVSVIVFYILVEMLIPYYRHLSTHAFVVRYAYLGNSVDEIFRNILLHPKVVFIHLFNPVNARYIEHLFGIWFIPSFLGLPILLVAIPLWLQHLLSLNMAEHEIYSFYGMTMAPFIFLALNQAFTSNRSRLNAAWFHGVIYMLIAVSLVQVFDYKRKIIHNIDNYADTLAAARWQLIRSIPPQAPVVATFNFLAPLSLRKDVYSFHKVYYDYFQDSKLLSKNELNTQARFVLPGNVKYALIDFSDTFIVHMMKFYPEVTHQRIALFLKEWRPVQNVGKVYLYVRILPYQK